VLAKTPMLGVVFARAGKPSLAAGEQIYIGIGSGKGSVPGIRSGSVPGCGSGSGGGCAGGSGFGSGGVG